MIKYHGLPITPSEAAIAAISGGHALVPFENPEQLELALDCCESICVDNSAFTKHKKGESNTDWLPYYEWISRFILHPSMDFALIPDVIGGREEENMALIAQWPFSKTKGCPVWHMHESMDYLAWMVAEFPRIAIGSSGEFWTIGTQEWIWRMHEAMKMICDENGFPKTKIHGLRMLDPKVFARFPFSSADSTNIARNIGIDSRWRRMAYAPPDKRGRARLIRDRIEFTQSPGRWIPFVSEIKQMSEDLFATT